MNKKFIASLMIALFLVSFIPITGLNGIKNVSAAPVCCEKTNSGSTCQYVDNSACAAGSKAAPTNCYFTSYCKLGTCFDLSDGRCYANMPLATCTAKGETASFSDLPLESTPQCDVGCCIIGNQASLITQTRCKMETAKYPDLQMVFKEEIKDESACVDLARSSDIGCCVQSSSSCLYTTRANCPQTTGTSLGGTGFFTGKYCSNPDLNCHCTSGKITGKKGCLAGSDNVYYFDSCGNPEDVAENCDYVTKSSTCGFDKTDNTYKCLDLSCTAGIDIFNLDGKTIYTNGKTIKNGESWCEYDVDMDKFSGKNSLVAFGRDLPGSRYYRGLCINNKIMVEPCKDFREEWCISDSVNIQGTTGSSAGQTNTYNYAACRLNRWNDCTNQKNKKDCENTDIRDCMWTSGKCVPFVSPGSKFWEQENKDVCSQANSECDVVISVPGLTKLLGENKGGQTGVGGILRGIDFVANLGGLLNGFQGEGLAAKPKCVANCDCLSHNYAISQNNLCRSLGDCGAEYNLLTNDGKQYENVLSGFEITNDGDIPDIVKYASGVPGNGDPGKITFADLSNWYTMEKPDSSAKETDKFTAIISKAWQPMMIGALEKGISIVAVPGAIIGHGFWKVFAKYAFKFVGPNVGKEAAKTTGVGFLGKALGKLGISGTTQLGTEFALQEVSKDITKDLTTKITENILKKSPEEAVKYLNSIGLKDIGLKDIVLGSTMTELDSNLASNIANNAATKILAKNGIEAGKKLTAESAKKAADLGTQLGVKTVQRTAFGTAMMVFSIFSYVDLALTIIDTFGTDTVTVKIKTTCSPWEAPTGSNDCAKCNPDDANALPGRTDKTCSEYTCKSFGTSCVLLNAGTGNETCVSQNPRDVIPPQIIAWKDGLGIYKDKITEVNNRGYTYNPPPIPAYTVFPLAIETNEPAQCRVSLNQSTTFDNMDVFGSGLYEYDHLVVGSLPVTYGIQGNGTIVPMPGTDYTLYIKCSDSLGNKNEAPYYIRYSIKEGPDTTPPVIEGTSISDNSYFAYGINQSDIEVYVNEPSDCKWSQTDQDYDKMENTMTCSHTPNDLSLYTCATTLKPLIDQIVNKFYFRCKDQPGVADKDRNTNEQSFELTLRGSYPLQIDSISPSGIVYTRNFTLDVETSKGATYDGKSYCYYGDTNDINQMTIFFKTNSSSHEQVLAPVRSPSPYTYYVSCIDYGGNFANTSTNITMSQDVTPPKVVKIYKDTSYTPAHLKIILDEVADCQYNIGKDFTYGDGTPMATDSSEQDALYNEGATYYIRCLDASNNIMLQIFHA